MDQNQNTTLFGLTIDNNSKTHLAEAARWARFLSIVGFVFVGLVAILAIFGGTLLSSTFSRYSSYNDQFGGAYGSGFAIGIIVYYLAIALIIFFAYLFLYRFSVNMKKALATNDQDTLNRSFQNLKILYRYWGILTIIGLAFFVIALLFAIVAGSSMGM